jgi:hypothetical protein
MIDEHSFRYFIFSFHYRVGAKTEHPIQKWATIIFCPDTDIEISALKSDLKEYYQSHRLADDIIVLAGDYLAEQVKIAFIEQHDDTFDRPFGYNEDFWKKHLKIFLFNETGNFALYDKEFDKLENATKDDEALLSNALNVGMTKIFATRGGLVLAHPSHHYVFPSGKHSDRFLRTGNVLLHSHEIFFIAFSILKFLRNDITRIYCDTSSINALAFALIELKRRFKKGHNDKFVPVSSFKSYDGLEQRKRKFSSGDLLLISASTSSNIVRRIKKVHPTVPEQNIVIVYYIDTTDRSDAINPDYIICNLKYDKHRNPLGIEDYKTYPKDSECVICKTGSTAVKVQGDVFLLEGPQVNNIMIDKKDAPPKLSGFINRYRKKSGRTAVFKANHKEISSLGITEETYEVYIDTDQVVGTLTDAPSTFKEFESGLERATNLLIPAHTRYIIHLDDIGSTRLADSIADKLEKIMKDRPILVPRLRMESELDDKDGGSVLVVASSLVRGRNLLSISRILRSFPRFSIAYLVGFIRTKNQTELTFISNNLCYGKSGWGTNPLYGIETFFCSDEMRQNSWKQEIQFFTDNVTQWQSSAAMHRLQALNPNTGNELFSEQVDNEDKSAALVDNLFYDSLKDGPLKLGNNFAFVDFDYQNDPLTQAEVYFIVSSILNQLRNNPEPSKRLFQTEYVRHLIDPNNFHRYNEGVIQASILRAATSSELYYALDESSSLRMKDMLVNMIRHPEIQADALPEFIYAIAVRKVTLLDHHCRAVIDELKRQQFGSDLLDFFIKVIDKQILGDNNG